MQTSLEKIAIEKRQGIRAKNAGLYGHSTESNQYTEKDALAKEGELYGKGTEKEYTHSIPTFGGSKTPSQQLDTSDAAGGYYDKEGRNGVSGRKRLVNINLYNSENQYSPEMIDTVLNEADGQVVIKYN